MLNKKALAASVTAKEIDSNFKQTVLLLHGDGTNGAQNNTFTDSSTNNFTITRNGNTTQGTFSPFSQSDGYWSNYLSASTDRFSVLFGTDFAFSGAYTVELWYYPTVSLGSNQYTFIGQESTGGFVAFIENTIQMGSRNVAIQLFGSANPTINAWNHIVIVRNSSNSTSIFLNGTRIGNATISTSYTSASGDFRIGGNAFGSGTAPGYYSNVRVVKGTAVYDPTSTTITVPTAALTSITDTVWLTCQSNRFVDVNTQVSAKTITVTGSPSVQPFSPFAPSAAYSASTNGGSGYFDENGDYLDCGNGGTDYEFGSGDFTIEGWFYCLGKSQRHQMIMAKGSPTTNNAYDWRLYWGDTANNRIWFDSNVFSVSSDTTTTEDLVLNAWNHIAVVRSGANGYFYLNGTRIDSVAASGTMNNSYTNVYVGAGNIGSASQTYYNGYANGIRLLKGTAQYTGSTYTVPTSPFTAITNTELLLNFTNAAIFDQTGKNNLETVGNAQIDTTTKKFGTGSMEFDGTGDYLICNSVTANPLEFGSGNFTIEFWLYLNSTGTQVIFDGRSSSASDIAPLIYYLSGLNYYTAGLDRITGGTLSTGQWYHIALSRSGTSTKLFIDGTQTGSTYTDSNSYVQFSRRPVIAAEGVTVGNNPLNGFIDDLRVTKGIARYTANFTPPAKAFADQ